MEPDFFFPLEPLCPPQNGYLTPEPTVISLMTIRYSPASTPMSEELWPTILPPEGISIHIKADNNGAIGLSAGTTPHSHTKQFDKMEVNYVQEQVQLQRVLLQKIPTEDNIADIFTKPLPESKFRRFRQGLGIET